MPKVSVYKRANDAGCATAMHVLGACFETERAVDEDVAKAVELYCRAIGKGRVDATCNLGRCLAKGSGVNMNRAKAAEMYLRSANGDYSFAIYNMGRWHVRGKGVRKDVAKGAEFGSSVAGADVPGVPGLMVAMTTERCICWDQAGRACCRYGANFVPTEGISDALWFVPTAVVCSEQEAALV
jgi:TPR repeat protein